MAGNISLALFAIIGLSLATLLTSYWISDQVNRDPEALNIAGSLRYQVYHVALAKEQNDPALLASAIQAIEQDWNHHAFNHYEHSNPELYTLYLNTKAQWHTLKEEIIQGGLSAEQLFPLINQQVSAIDTMVNQMQQHAEKTVQSLRLLFIVALFLSVGFAVVVVYWLRVRFQTPLQNLQHVAQQISQGDFTARFKTQPRNDELDTLGLTINKMANTIGYMYGSLESRVDEQTKQLQRSHTTLQLLYDISTRINDHSLAYNDFRDTTLKLRDVLKLGELELCLVTETGDSPYMQFHSNLPEQQPCAAINCAECIRRDDAITVENGVRSYHYPLKRDDKRFGVLVARCKEHEVMHDWQKRLLKLVSDQLALALSLKTEEDQVRRLAMVNERTVIARELHDSLAQALSYLKIQVTRLNKALTVNNQDIIDDVSKELKNGLDSAYRQLRELLTTFRLKLDGDGLLNALETTATQLRAQTDMEVQLDYRISDIPLAPHEEIHLLQMIREAAQNAINHSEGSLLVIRLETTEEGTVALTVEDDGKGIPQQPERLNHYGLAIIKERARHLGGIADIKPRTSGGTRVHFHFVPAAVQRQNPEISEHISTVTVE
ncbi:nitrate/nitrite two-component system sensor histidine kinase [Aliidiomarina taiwanensis]|uniref:Sensor protein n=1 Tax=Aliidiomarina taiwanensis TaxID=946228 RepID=A0A432X8E7_9GAMM|nr:nitrate/nitrite two-component system sensor histidine kinase [Aliidiomarina taiwanensis]